MDKIAIITGGSKGIGLGLVAAYLKNGYRVFSISRKRNEADHDAMEQIECDLSNPSATEALLPGIFEKLNPESIQKIVLINNAGTLGKIAPLEANSTADIQQTVQLNTVTPLILTSVFLRLTQEWACRKIVLNISSGAAQNPYFGWTNYCVTKASLDMLTRVVALEQSQLKNGAKILSVYPGVVDTGMQEQIRSSDAKDFIDLEKFKDYKKSGSLADAAAVGEKIYQIDQRTDIESGAILDVRNPDFS